MANNGPNTSNMNTVGVVCARSWFAPRTPAENGTQLDELNPDGTLRNENAAPNAQTQNQNTETNPGGPGGRGVREDEDEDQRSTMDAQCRPIKDFTRLLSCYFCCSTERKNRRNAYDAPPEIVRVPAGSVISPTPPPPRESPERSPLAVSRLPSRESVTPTRCTLV